jgi:Insertion element 4 transposase N-terminal
MHPWVGLSNDVRLGAVARWVTPELVAGALDDCGVRDKKPGALPAGFMVYFTLALALFQQDSCDDVAEHMVGGVPGLGGSIPNRSSFTRARQRLGAQAIERVFRKLTGPLAPVGLEGSFYRGMRLAAVGGFVLDAPETEANRRRLGGPKDARGQVAGFPQVRVVTLTETGTHAQIDAAVDGFCCGEPELAVRLAASAARMLVIMDRGFPGVALWRAYTGAGAHLLIRARSCVAARPIGYLPDGTYLARMNLAGQKRAAPGHVVLRVIEYQVDGGEVIRLLTDLLDPEAYPAAELAAVYRERWEAESSYPPGKDVPARATAGSALRQPRTGLPGGMGASGRPPLPDQDHGAGRRRGNRPGPHLFPEGPQACAAQRDSTNRHHSREDDGLHGHPGIQGRPQARQRSPASARRRPAAETTELEVFLP